MTQEVPLRFYGFVFYEYELFRDAPPNTQLLKFFTFDENDIEGADSLDIAKFGADSLDIAKFGAADLILEEPGAEKDPTGSLYMPQFPPVCAAQAYCPVTRSLILAGGGLFKVPHLDPYCSDSVWSIKATTTTPPTWKFCRKMGQARAQGLAVPYDDQKIYIFGGDSPIDPVPTLEIYDPSTGDLSDPIPLHEDIGTSTACSYFLWKDSSAPHKKPLIMLHYGRFWEGTPCPWLWSYDVEGKRLEIFDNRFPAFGFKYMKAKSILLPLARHNTLLIIDQADTWRVYDLRTKSVKATVVLELEGLEPYTVVRHGFCRYSSDSRAFVYLFMERFDSPKKCVHDLTCVKFRLDIDEEGYYTDRVWKVALPIGENSRVDLFASADDLGGQGRKRKRNDDDLGGQGRKKKGDDLGEQPP